MRKFNKVDSRTFLKPFMAALLFYLAASVFGMPAFAAGEAKELTLNQAIDMALAYSPNLEASREDLAVAHLQEKQAYTHYLPTLSTNYGYSRADSEPTVTIAGRVYPAGTTDIYSWSTRLDQPVFTGFRVSSSHRLAELGVDVAKINLRLIKLDLALAVKEAYLSYLRAIKGVLVGKQGVELLEDQLRISKDFYEVGIVPITNVLKTEVDLANSRQRLLEVENLVAVTRASLNRLLGLPLDRTLKVKDILQHRKVSITYQVARNVALAERPEIKALALQLKQADQSIKVAGSEFYPQVNLRGSFNKQSDSPEMSDSMFYDPYGWAVTATVDWTFWEWGRTRYKVSAEKAKKKRIEAMRREMEDRVDLDVKQAYLSLREAEKSIATARAAITQAEENYRITQDRFKEQLTTNTEVLDARVLLTRAQDNYYSALRTFNVAQARLQRAMGRGLPGEANP